MANSRDDIHDATGRRTFYGPYGWLRMYGTSAPTNGTSSAQVGASVGCIYQKLSGSGPFTYINVGSVTSPTWIPIDTNAVSALGFIPLPLTSFRAISSNDIPAQAGTPIGGLLCSDSAPKYIRINTSTDKGLRIQWAASGVIEITTSFYYPPDLDATKAVTVNLRASMGGASDTPVITIAYFEGIGDTNRGSNTAAVTGTTIATYSNSTVITPTAAHPNYASVSLTPGTHGTDVLNLYEAYILYTKKVLTT